MKKIPTAEEMVVRWQNEVIKNMGTQNADVNSLENAFIAFAKLHVEACKEEIAEKAEIRTEEIGGGLNIEWKEVDKNSILNSYPLDKIK